MSPLHKTSSIFSKAVKKRSQHRQHGPNLETYFRIGQFPPMMKFPLTMPEAVDKRYRVSSVQLTSIVFRGDGSGVEHVEHYWSLQRCHLTCTDQLCVGYPDEDGMKRSRPGTSGKSCRTHKISECVRQLGRTQHTIGQLSVPRETSITRPVHLRPLVDWEQRIWLAVRVPDSIREKGKENTEATYFKEQLKGHSLALRRQHILKMRGDVKLSRIADPFGPVFPFPGCLPSLSLVSLV